MPNYQFMDSIKNDSVLQLCWLVLNKPLLPDPCDTRVKQILFEHKNEITFLFLLYPSNIFHWRIAFQGLLNDFIAGSLRHKGKTDTF